MGVSGHVAIVPGNGGGNLDIAEANWYGWVRDKLEEHGCSVELHNMPDPELARSEYWIPFMHNDMKCGPETIIIGHSSGAVAAMRYAEQYKVRGIILVSAYVTDMGDSCERASGYFDDPWNWDAIKSNCPLIVQFGSTDDPFLPWEEQQQVADGLHADLRKYNDTGHFQNRHFPDLVKTVVNIFKNE